ncbi:MAG TPA: hypothetical protein EYP49_07400 [Anaerolineae bacterium]|nr:hypothetical protein [Anaerolineae bacterium]
MNPGFPSPSKEKEILNRMAGQLTSRKTAIASELHQALRTTALSNRLLIAPRRLEEIAQEEVEAFLHFLETADEEEARQRGARRASEGLGEHPILAMTEALRQSCWMMNLEMEELRIALEATGRYITAFLAGYMSGREKEIMKEQERTRHAFRRVLEKQTRS